jgi:hypothetical protein
MLFFTPKYVILQAETMTKIVKKVKTILVQFKFSFEIIVSNQMILDNSLKKIKLAKQCTKKYMMYKSSCITYTFIF